MSGFTNLSNTRASEWVGILDLLIILAQSETGRILIDNALLKGGNGETRDVLYMFEMILCFDAWINQETFWPSERNNEFVNSVTK